MVNRVGVLGWKKLEKIAVCLVLPESDFCFFCFFVLVPLYKTVSLINVRSSWTVEIWVSGVADKFKTLFHLNFFKFRKFFFFFLFFFFFSFFFGDAFCLLSVFADVEIWQWLGFGRVELWFVENRFMSVHECWCWGVAVSVRTWRHAYTWPHILVHIHH